ncbi:MAG: ribosome maturation factor RimP [Burkholderiales bacterium]
MTNITELLEKTVSGLGFELVDVEISNSGRMLRVFIDKPNGVNVDDCAAVSNHLTRLFAVEEVEFDRLEISSPGLDRPLKRPADFRRFVGEQARVKVRLPLNGRKKFAGLLRSVEEEGIRLEVEGEIVAIAFSEIDKARLIPNI